MTKPRQSALRTRIATELEKLALTPDEEKRVLQQLQKPERVRKSLDMFANSRSVKYGVVSDLHIGSKHFRPDVFEQSIKTFNREGVDAILLPGDVIEGMSNRDGHVYELDTIGTTAQVNKAAELLQGYKQPILFTTGNHDEWSKKKSNQGVIVGPTLEDKLGGNAKWLGEYTADIKLSPTTFIRLTHEGNSSYALSYSGQKRINGLSHDEKPAAIINGHIHKALYMFYRNIHYFEAGTLQDQTDFMRMKGSPAMVGYWVIKLGHNRKGVNTVAQTFYPGY